MKVSFTTETIKHQMVLLLFTICFRITDAENAVELVKYQELKREINVSFTTKVTAYKCNRIECFLVCNLDTSCLGVDIQETNEDSCFIIHSNPTGDSMHLGGIIYLKESECPLAFTKIGNLTGCYHIAAQEVSWDDAQEACQATHPQAHLVSFDSREEMEVVSESVSVQYDRFFNFWTGGKDHEETNQLTWTGTGELVPVEPDFWYHDNGPQHSHGDCVTSYNDNYNGRFLSDLYTDECDVNYPYVCEIH